MIILNESYKGQMYELLTLLKHIMTPKEKAQELYDLFYFVDTHDGYGEYDKELTHNDRKECVRILVKELVDVLVFTDMSTMVGRFCERKRNYLTQVLEELENIEIDWI